MRYFESGDAGLGGAAPDYDYGGGTTNIEGPGGQQDTSTPEGSAGGTD